MDKISGQRERAKCKQIEWTHYRQIENEKANLRTSESSLDELAPEEHAVSI